MKKILIVTIFFILGGIASTSILYPQIQNRYDMGHNAGRIEGGYEVIHFLQEHVQNNTLEKITDTENYLDFKDARISVVELNEVQTIVIE